MSEAKQVDMFREIDQNEAEYESAFIVDLDVFEGPIEMLLTLVKKTKIPIMEVNLADITDAYLAEIKESGVLDMDNAAAFITVATMLIDIKAKALLPDLSEVISDQPTISPEKILKLQMQKYELFKEASSKLKTHEEVNMLFKAPEEGATDERVVIADMNIEALLDAFAKMLHKVEIKQKVSTPRKIIKDRFTVADKMVQIKDAVKLRGSVVFTEMFELDYSRSEIINTFLALLELLKRQCVSVEQQEIFNTITITYKGEGIQGADDYTEEEHDA